MEFIMASLDNPAVFGAIIGIEVLMFVGLVIMFLREDALIAFEDKLISVVKHNFKARRLARCRKVLAKYNYIMNKERR